MEAQQRPSPTVRFGANIVVVFEVISDLITLCSQNGIAAPVSGLIIEIGKSVISKQDHTSLTNKFISKTAQHWDLIKKRDSGFLTRDIATLFDDEPLFKEHMAGVTKLFNVALQKKFVTQEGKEMSDKMNDALSEAFTEKIEELWEIIEACVKITISYIDEERKPELVVSKSDDGSQIIKRRYTAKFFPDLSVKNLCEIWNVKI